MFQRLLRVASGLLLCFGMAVVALASSDVVERVEPVVRDGMLYIDADSQFTVNSELRYAAERGVPLYFTADLQIMKQRWWWFDESVVDQQLTWRIVYNALTRQWKVGRGELALPESSFDDALAQVRHIRNWQVAHVDALEHDVVYQGRLRVRLDTSLLARPFQVDALNSSAWSLATAWRNFTFSISVNDPSK
jgi:hypothetical protein